MVSSKGLIDTVRLSDESTLGKSGLISYNTLLPIIYPE